MTKLNFIVLADERFGFGVGCCVVVVVEPDFGDGDGCPRLGLDLDLGLVMGGFVVRRGGSKVVGGSLRQQQGCWIWGW
ncbi:hypothetical protein QYF36_004525 [Acer negundo]|nr:hypothetical protein QYF36_004525 [Acer negundo]